MTELFIVDALSFLFRSYHAIRGMTNREGESTHALYGFIRSLDRIRKKFAPSYLVVVFDGPNNKVQRQAIYPSYKAHRQEMPEDLFAQLKLTQHYCQLSGLSQITTPNVEADDQIGALVQWATGEGVRVTIFSSDKDLFQLVGDRVTVINPFKDDLLIDTQKVQELLGVTPAQVVDYLALVGDAADGIPGVVGIGPKTASALLQSHGTLKRLLTHLHEVKPAWRDKLERSQEAARLSYQLASLIVDLPPPVNLEQFALVALDHSDVEKLRAFYQEMQFTTLLQALPQPAGAPAWTPTTVEITSVEMLDDLLVELDRATYLALVATSEGGSSPIQRHLSSLTLATQQSRTYHIDFDRHTHHRDYFEALKPCLTEGQIVLCGYGIKQLKHLMAPYQIELARPFVDLELASYLLAPERRATSLEGLYREMTGDESCLGSRSGENRIDRLGRQAAWIITSIPLIENKIKQAGLEPLFKEVELPLLDLLFKMERNGIYLDPHLLHEIGDGIVQEQAALEREIFAIAGAECNLRSPKQLAHLLFDQLKIVPPRRTRSTGAAVLELLQQEHPIASKLLAYRVQEKLLSTYIRALPKHIDPETNRIHCTFKQSTTATGRLACEHPNLQNIPIRTPLGRQIRRAFCPEQADHCYLSADYSQIELRLLAHFSQEPKLLEAFDRGEDVHTLTAALLFNVPQQQVTDQMRLQAKTVNFGILYGQQAYGLSQELQIDRQTAQSFITCYFERYPCINNFFDQAKEQVRVKGFASTLLGRKRPIPDITSSNAMLRLAAERLAINTPLQGSQADLIKKAMLQVDQELSGISSAKMLVQIHDELLFELPESELSLVQQVVTERMEGVVDLRVPLIVNLSIGKNWAEC